MRSVVPNLSERLTALLAPPAKLDDFDNLAIDIIGEATSHPFKEARTLIAERLRLLHSRAVADGATRLAAEIKREFAS